MSDTNSNTAPSSVSPGLRLALCVLGGAAGVFAWLVFDLLPDLHDSDRLVLALGSTGMAFFAAALAMTGPLSVWRAMAMAAPVALVAGGGLTLASYRYDDIGEYAKTVHPLAAYAVVVGLPLAFLIAGRCWRDYAVLFTHAWGIVVRYAAGGLFVGLFWLVLALSNTLLSLVDIDLIESLWDKPWFILIVSGAVLGLALAVVNEMSDYVSPFLILRLLRLFLPVVLGVVAIFVIAVPIRGLENVFGGLSAAATLLAMGLAAATLVSTAVDEGPDAEVRAPLMRLATRALALLMPVIAGLACVAIGLRVAQYGWTPARFSAAAAGGVVLLYGLAYSTAVLRKGDWALRIRRVNSVMALGLVLVCVLWLTPVLNVERMSANNQVARYLAGKTPLTALDLEALHGGWGKAGRAALTRLETDKTAPEHADLVKAIAAARLGNTFDVDVAQERATHDSNLTRLAQSIVVLPKGQDLPQGTLASLRPFELRRWLDACARVDSKGRTGCVAVVADFLPGIAGPEVIIALRDPDGSTRTQTLITNRSGGLSWHGQARTLPDPNGWVPELSIEALLDGDFAIREVPRYGLSSGDATVLIPN